MSATTMTRPLNEPLHISVDGSLRNPHVALAAAAIALLLLVVAHRAIVLVRQRRYKAAVVVLVGLCVLSVGGAQLSHLLAFLLQSAIARRITSTTFFGGPPAWLFPAVVAIGAVLAALLQMWRRPPTRGDVQAK